jgi:branched-chain amino acid transport system permease protein
MNLDSLKKFDLVIVVAGFLALVPLVSLQRTTDFIIFCIFVLAYDLLYGHMGRLSFGHMLYLGVGAYAAALSSKHVSTDPLLAIGVATAAGVLVGAIMGPIIVRTTGACFALINLAFNQMGYFLVLFAFSNYTGGEDGMSAVFGKVAGLDLSNRTVIFVFSLLCLVGVVYLMRRLTTSTFGILLRAIKENDTRVQFLGYNTFGYKWTGFIISTGLSAFAGSLSILNYTYVTPSFIDPTRSVEVIFASLIGGAGNVYGALLGGVGYMIISNYLPKYIQRWEMFLGIALLLMVFRFRGGIWGFLTGIVAGRRAEVRS